MIKNFFVSHKTLIYIVFKVIIITIELRGINFPLLIFKRFIYTCIYVEQIVTKQIRVYDYSSVM